MSTQANPSAAEQFRADMYHGAVAVADHIRERSSLLDGVLERHSTMDRDTNLRVLFDRTHAWAASLRKLDHASDMQAVAACTRALLEITVDMLLLHGDKTNESGLKMRWWDLSAKLQMAVAFVQSHKERGTADPSEYEAHREFIDRNESFVRSLRKKWWPTCVDKKGDPKHPQRWNGDWNLLTDVREADRHNTPLISGVLGSTLMVFYHNNYQILNRVVHGSGVLGVRGTPDALSFRCGIGYWSSASLAMICTQVILKDFGFAEHLPDIRNEWERIRSWRGASLVEHAKTLVAEDFS
jgi:hypothetical protein